MSVQLMMMMMMAVLLTTSASLGSADEESNCKEVVKPMVLENTNFLLGRWVFHVGASDDDDSLKHLRKVKNHWIVMTETSDSGVLNLRWGESVNNKCLMGNTNSTYLELSPNGTYINFDHYTTINNGTYYELGPESYTWLDNASDNSTHHKDIIAFTRDGKLDDVHLEIFKKQVACLDFHSVLHFGDNTELCPDEKEAVSQ